MYNVEEAYIATIKLESDHFKKLLTYTEKQIQLAIKKGAFMTYIDLDGNIYFERDINQLQKLLIFLGYKIKRNDYTNNITRLYIQWTEAEYKNYLDKE